ncbi:MAG: hypothetical protein HQL06_13650 [Nitrospirae bacterium]|nr:hypothetical protein [Nitrospirota bacterium]
MIEEISQRAMQNVQSTSGMYVAKKSLDVMKAQGQMAVALINSVNVGQGGGATNPAGTGTLVNMYV